ncbi:MAG TPA: sulfate/thiosulfate ABC transporter permease CysW, partial [Gammaproteobacteria bacterium]|nr:sulfate/thiosulfate ABC transporter permease CysW [Gammaproteobacteria bacterium]
MNRSKSTLRIGDQFWVKWSLITLALTVTVLLLVIPLVLIFDQAFSGGAQTFWDNLTDTYTLRAIGLTLFIAAMTVPINLVF